MAKLPVVANFYPYPKGSRDTVEILYFHLDVTPEESERLDEEMDDFDEFTYQEAEMCGIADVGSVAPFFFGYDSYDAGNGERSNFDCLEFVRKYFLDRGFSCSEIEVYSGVKIGEEDDSNQQYIEKHGIETNNADFDLG